MTYDPRAKGLADGLYPERTGKTTRVVATLVARDAIPSGEKYDGMLVQVLETRKLYSWDTANATWDTITGGSGIAKFATLVDLQAATGMTDGDFATTLDTDKLYRYTNGAWVEFTAGGSGGGIAKYADVATIRAIANPKECDYAVALDTGMMYQYLNGQWITAFNTFTDPSAEGSWALVGSVTCNGTVPTGEFDVAGASKIRIETSQTGISSALVFLSFDADADSGANTLYTRENMNATSNTPQPSVNTNYAGLIAVDGVTKSNRVLDFDTRSKIGYCSAGYLSGALVGVVVESFLYTGTQPMNKLRFNTSSGSFSGTINVYKWVEKGKPLDLITYELVKEWNLSNTTLDETIPWNGEIDDMLFMESSLGAQGTNVNLFVAPNGDVTLANYVYTSIVGDGSAATSSKSSTFGGMFVNNSISTSARGSMTTAFLRKGNKRIMMNGTASDSLVSDNCSAWTNTVDPVTSLRIYTSGAVVSGFVRLYKKVKTALITTNPNLNTLWHKYVDANTVQMQPGEIEINGAVMKVQKATNVTLSGNLKAGLTEAANTVYYMYAVRPTSGNNIPTYLFDTQAPLMDRYGNTVASFEDCDAAHAWFHPTLGVNYRWVGQVLNDASSNLAAYDKCMPGYWESAYTSIPGTGIRPLQHAFGKVNFNARILFKSALTDTTAHERVEFYMLSSTQHGVMLGSHDNKGVAIKSATSVVMNTAQSNVFVHDGAWRSTGYYKLIITEN